MPQRIRSARALSQDASFSEHYEKICSWCQSPVLNCPDPGSPRWSLVDFPFSSLEQVALQGSTRFRGGNTELGWMCLQGLHRAAVAAPHSFSDKIHATCFWRIKALQPVYSAVLLVCFHCTSTTSSVPLALRAWLLELEWCLEKSESMYWDKRSDRQPHNWLEPQSFSTASSSPGAVAFQHLFLSVLHEEQKSGVSSHRSGSALLWSLWLLWWRTWWADLSLSRSPQEEVRNCNPYLPILEIGQGIACALTSLLQQNLATAVKERLVSVFAQGLLAPIQSLALTSPVSQAELIHGFCTARVILLLWKKMEPPSDKAGDAFVVNSFTTPSGDASSWAVDWESTARSRLLRLVYAALRQQLLEFGAVSAPSLDTHASVSAGLRNGDDLIGKLFPVVNYRLKVQLIRDQRVELFGGGHGSNRISSVHWLDLLRDIRWLDVTRRGRPVAQEEYTALKSLLALCLEFTDPLLCPTGEGCCWPRCILSSPAVVTVLEWLSEARCDHSCHEAPFWEQLRRLSNGDEPCEIPEAQFSFLFLPLVSLPQEKSLAELRPRLLESLLSRNSAYSAEESFERIKIALFVWATSPKSALRLRVLLDALLPAPSLSSAVLTGGGEEVWKNMRQRLCADPIATQGLWLGLMSLTTQLAHTQQWMLAWTYLQRLTMLCRGQHEACAGGRATSVLLSRLWLAGVWVFAKSHLCTTPSSAITSTKEIVVETGSYWAAVGSAIKELYPLLKKTSHPFSIAFDERIRDFSDIYLPRDSSDMKNRTSEGAASCVCILLDFSPCQQYLQVHRIQLVSASHKPSSFSCSTWRVQCLIGVAVRGLCSRLERWIDDNKQRLRAPGQGSTRSGEDEVYQQKLHWWEGRMTLEGELHDLMDEWMEALAGGPGGDSGDPASSLVVPLLLVGEVSHSRLLPALTVLSEEMCNRCLPWCPIQESNITEQWMEALGAYFLLILQGLPLLLAHIPHPCDEGLAGDGGEEPMGLSLSASDSDYTSSQPRPHDARQLSSLGVKLRKRFGVPPCPFPREEGCTEQGVYWVRFGRLFLSVAAELVRVVDRTRTTPLASATGIEAPFFKEAYTALPQCERERLSQHIHQWATSDTHVATIAAFLQEALKRIAEESPRIRGSAALHHDVARVARHHVFLLVEDPLGQLQRVPWEVLSPLRLQSVSRVPSITYLLWAAQEWNRKQRTGHSFAPRVFDHPLALVDPESTTLVSVLKNAFIAEEGHGALLYTDLLDSSLSASTASKVPQSLLEFMQERQGGDQPFSTYVYIGHKAGEAYLHREELLDSIPPPFLRQTSGVPPVVLLMGCSSVWGSSCAPPCLLGKPREPLPMAYLHAGASTVVGTLWEVTNREIDGVLLTLWKLPPKRGRGGVEEESGTPASNRRAARLERRRAAAWGADEHSSNALSPMTLGEGVVLARHCVSFPMLTGAATVLFGVNEKYI